MASKKQKPGQPDPEEEEYDYKDVQWKDFVTKPKYIRRYNSTSRCGVQLTGRVAFWILGLVVIALSAVIVIRHDQVVNVYPLFSAPGETMILIWIGH